MTSIALIYCRASHDSRPTSVLEHASHIVHDRAADAELVAKLRAGSDTAFQYLFRTHIDGLIRFATSYVHDPDAARDIVDDVFLSIWQQRATWIPEHGVAVYLYGAVRNRALNHERARRRRAMAEDAAARTGAAPGHSASPARPDDQLEYADLAATVWRAIDALPEPRRQAVILRWQHAMSAPEIAAILGVSQGAVYQLLNRAHELLYRLLSPVFR